MSFNPNLVPPQVGGKVAMDLTMPTMLAWVLGGNADKLSFQDRTPHCRLPDKPKTFHEQVSPRHDVLSMTCWPN